MTAPEYDTGPSYADRTAAAQRALRGEGEPPLLIDKRLGAPLDLVTGRVACPRCGMDTMRLEQASALPSYLNPEVVLAALRCRSCDAQMGISLEQDEGAVVLRTSLPR